jgi:hypothetical protein
LLCTTAPAAAAQETVEVLADRVLGPVTQRGTGFIQGPFSNDEPAEDLVAPLKVRRFRGAEKDVVGAYQRCKASGASMELVTNNWTNWDATPMGVDGDWTAWEKYHTDLVNRMRARGMGDVHYAVFTESCARGLGWVEKNQAHYLEAYRRAYRAIRQADPQAVIVGPNAQWGPFSWWWEQHKGDNTWFVRQFLDYCIANECVPDVIAWHDYACDGSGVLTDAAVLRAYFKEKGLGSLPLEEDDIGCKEGQFRPGTFVAYLANIERARIDYTVKCCWDNDCWGNTLNGLLTKTSREKRSLWWTYFSYAELAGHIVEVASSASVDGVVGRSARPATVRGVFGRHRDGSGPVLLRYRGLGRTYKKAAVVAERIPNTEAGPLSRRELKIDRLYTITRGQVDVTLDDLGPFDAYAVTLTLLPR